jgi:hypothetical protein
MCFGGGGSAAPVTPAPAPAAPIPEPYDSSIGTARKAEEQSTFGQSQPTMRVDRSSQGGATGGSGLNM